MAARLEEQPAGTVTGVYPQGAEREGAYRLLENGRVDAEALERARNLGCASRMEELGGVFLVPLDKTSIQLSDREGVRDFGSVGNRRYDKRGVQALTALALDAEGAPLGVLYQEMWARGETQSPPRRPGHRSRKRDRDRRPPEARESMRWVDAMRAAHALAQQHAPSARLWFQLDREGDFWGVHQLVDELGADATVRMLRNHVVRDADRRKAPLMTWLKEQPLAAWFQLTLAAHDGRPQRVARLSLRWGTAWLRLSLPGGRTRWVSRTFVYVDEPHRPRAHNRIQWLLATTARVRNVDEALRVVDAYKRRWRIEDFHRAWKSGCCNIESSQLQSLGAFRRWSIFTSSMAARAEHIKHYAREYPDAPATLVYTQEEIDAMIDWRLCETPKARTPYKPGDVPRLTEMTRWVGELGGYMKSSKAPPPGVVTLSRGLARLGPMVWGRRTRRRRRRTTSG